VVDVSWVEGRWGWTRILMIALPIILSTVNLLLVYKVTRIIRTATRQEMVRALARVIALFLAIATTWYILASIFASYLALGEVGWTGTESAQRLADPNYRTLQELVSLFNRTLVHIHETFCLRYS
jgi:type II secretory pathway pseudopilin PulG